ncbi:MAG: hypothetical protein JWP81_4044 [Ferruginibacter sp.]|nr:hypothetical protein [Ferruginibacter sp.]
MAHCMTNIIRFKGHPFEDGCNPQYYSPFNNPTASIGGLTQVNVLNEELLKDATLDEAVAFEMLAAKRSGIDGFQFYYTLNDHGSDEIIKAYFRVADKKKIDFKFALCISHPAGSNEEQKIYTFSRRINAIMDAAGRGNKHWLRTPDGRMVVYLWYGEQLADVPDNSSLTKFYYAARAFNRLGEAVHEKFACIYSINEEISQDALNSCLDYFPAVWLWTLPYKKNYIGNFVAAACKSRKRIFTGSAFPDFYTSKILKPGTWEILNASDAVEAGLQKTERKAIVTGLSYNFRKMMEFSIEQDVPIINIITWNDYPEGHHLAPESNHNDGFSLLLKYYKKNWLNSPAPLPPKAGAELIQPGRVLSNKEELMLNDTTTGKELAIAFYKKYPVEVKPVPYNIPVIYVEKGATKPSGEDGIEVVTILSAQAVLILNGDSAMVGAGMNVTRFKQQSGPVHVIVRRLQNNFIDFTAPEEITNTPIRSDRLTYTYSNETAEFYKALFGDTILEKIPLNTN